ncbi:hypothetical protein [Pandoraea sputorum]
MDSISNVNVTAPAISTVVPEADRRDDTVQLSRDLNAAVQATTDSSLPMSKSTFVSSSTTIETRSAGRVDREAKIENAKQEMWQVIRECVAAERTMIMPYSLIELDEAGRKQVTKMTVEWALTPVNSDTGKWFDCLTKNEMIREYLKDTVSEEMEKEVRKIPELINVLGGIYYYDMLRGNSNRSATTGSVPNFTPEKTIPPDPTKSGELPADATSRTNVALHSATGVGNEVREESAKQEMWIMVRDGVKHHHDMIMPASFMLLDEDGRKRVAKLTVQWVFTPVDANTEKWFNRFTGNKTIQPYLKSTVTKSTRAEADKIRYLKDVVERIHQYGMLIWNS